MACWSHHLGRDPEVHVVSFRKLYLQNTLTTTRRRWRVPQPRSIAGEELLAPFPPRSGVPRSPRNRGILYVDPSDLHLKARQ